MRRVLAILFLVYVAPAMFVVGLFLDRTEGWQSGEQLAALIRTIRGPKA